MTVPIFIQPEAEAEITEAYRWYEEKCSGLGRVFLERVEEAFDRIQAVPELHAMVLRNVRQTLVKQFPYVICYVFENGVVDVVAVFEGHRDPMYWKYRID